MKTKDKENAAEEQSDIGHLPLERILLSKKLPNYRSEADDGDGADDELYKDIAANGLINPLTIWVGENPGETMKLGESGEEAPKTFLLAGGRRRAALKRLKAKDAAKYKALFPTGVPVMFKMCPLQDAIFMQLRENVQRKDVPAEDVIPVIKRLMTEFKLKQKEVAKKIGKSEAYVTGILAIEEELGEEAVEEIKSGKVSLNDARKGAKEVKEARKAGKPITGKAALAKVKAKSAAKKASGRKRDEKRESVKSLYKKYKALPSRTLGAKVQLLEGLLDYVTQVDGAEIPEDLQSEEGDE